MEINKKNFFLKGDSIYLRPLNLEDLAGNYRYWLNDPEVVRNNSHGRFAATLQTLEAYVRNATVSTTSLVLAVITTESDQHIGNVSLQGINWVDRNAEIAFLLGELSFHGKGIMFEAGKLLINHAFRALNLHRIYCGTSSDNIGMQKLAAKLGMVREGVRKDAIFNQGRYFDIVEYGIINETQIED